MSHKLAKHITLGVLFASLMLVLPVHAVENFKISSYGGGHQIWFEAEEFDERNPQGDQYFPIVDQSGAFGQAVGRAGGAGGMIRWTFDISEAGGMGGTWYFWARVINPSNNSDFMIVEGHPGDVIPDGPPFPGTMDATEFNNSQRVFEENMGPPWVWGRAGHEEAHTKELKDGENSMYIFHRQGSNVFWDVFMWTDKESYVPTDDDYQNATVVLPDKAYDPIPSDGATDAPIDMVLSWMAGDDTSPTNGHKLYFSENIDDVTKGIGAITLTPSTYVVPQRLDFAKTYYWRVDEITPNGTVIEGSLWSFTTELFSYPVLNVTTTASSSATDKGPENTVNGSGLDSTGMLHGNQGSGTMWLSDAAGPQPTWILFEFDNVYKLYEMFVWNSNESLEPEVGLGFKNVLIEYSRDGVDFVTLGTTHEFERGTGSADYAHNTIIDMKGIGAKFVRLTANSNWADILPQFGLSEVRFFYIPVQASQPDPPSGAFDVALDLDLSWKRGRESEKHDLYFSDDLQAVADGTAPVISVSDASYGPLSLNLGKNYFWRVDEVNDAETPSTWPGQVWNFMTIKSLLIDDFESYNDLDPAHPASNRIFNTWIDGYDDLTNGSLVGYDVPPFVEQTIVLGGKQSMPMFYDNTVGKSEATLTLIDIRDWTVHSINRLTIWFRGDPNNAAENLYVALNNNAVVNYDDPDAAITTTWTPWNIDLTRFAEQGVNLTDVDSISIGLGNKTNPQPGGSGIMYFDSIGLYPERQAPEQKQTNSVFEAEDADVIGSGWRTYRDVTSSGGVHIGSNVGDGSFTNVAPGVDWVLRYSFTAEAGVYKIVARVIAPTIDDDSFWVRILDAESQTHEHPGQPGTGWVRFNDIVPGTQAVWDEVHSSDHSGEVVNWTLAAGNYTLEIAKREDGASIDAILITDDLALDPATLP